MQAYNTIVAVIFPDYVLPKIIEMLLARGLIVTCEHFVLDQVL